MTFQAPGRKGWTGFLAGCGRIVLLLAVSVALVCWLDPVLHSTTPLGLILRNALPMALFLLLLYALSGRLLLSMWLAGGTGWLLFALNAIKQRDMNEPVMPGDWVLRSQLLHHAAFFSHYTSSATVMLLWIVAFVLVGVLLIRAERNWIRSSLPLRGLLLLASLTLLYTAFRGDGFWKDVYSDDALAAYAPWDPIASVQGTGLLASLVRMTQDARISVPDPDRGVVTTFAKAHAAQLEARADRKPPQERPDIIVVQSEAFFEPGVLKDITPGEFDPNFARLSATGITGALETPAYGGGTIRTEFETLTGYPMGAFPSINYPYYGLAAAWMPTVPRRLQAFGYTTTLFHPFRGDFWNRQEVMPQLGFQNSHYEKDFANAAHAGFYVSDQALFDVVLAHLQKEDSRPSYTMLITMENHGPWGNDVTALPHALDGRALPEGLSVQGRRELTYYLSHLVNGDAALGDFAQRLLARPRWTILLFYGDHLPSLNYAFRDLHFDNGLNHTEQQTRYMLVSNRPLQPRQLDANAYELPGLLFDTIGLPDDGYLAFDGAIRDAESADAASRRPDYGQVSLNAARMEVRCRHELTLQGTCPRKQQEHAARSAEKSAGSTDP
jgi:phosphoglycerol transferase MdoB-like AlkP superfamily enzyme